MNKRERGEAIVRCLQTGKTLQCVGDDFGLTRERVRQIARDFGFEPIKREKVALAKTPRTMSRPYWGIRQACKAAGLPDPFRKFGQHVAHAERRGIDFFLTFEEWWAIWEAQYPERGTGSECKVMRRLDDNGPYAIGNVRIETRAETQMRRLSSRSQWKKSKHRVSPEVSVEWVSRNRSVVTPEEEFEQKEDGCQQF